MIERRPPLAYLLLFCLTLMAYVLADLGRFLLALGALLLVGLAYRLPRPMLQPNVVMFSVGTALLMAFNYFLLYADQDEIYLSIYSWRLINSVSLGLLILIVIQWYSKRSAQFDWLLFSIGLFLVFSGVSWRTVQHKPVYLWVVLSFIGTILVLLVFRLLPRMRFRYSSPPSAVAERYLRLYYLRTLLVLGIFLGTSLLGIRSYEVLDQHFNEMLTGMLTNQNKGWSGFSGNTLLSGNQEVHLSERIAFTVESPHALDYWRGNILTHYHNGHWYPQETLFLSEQESTRSKSKGVARPKIYNLVENPPPRSVLFNAKVHLNDYYNGLLFVPYEARQVVTPAQTRIYQNQYHLLRRELEHMGQDYQLWLGESKELPVDNVGDILKENLQIDSGVQRQLLPLARAVSGGNTPLVAAARIESWFHQNFLYSLKMRTLTPGMDPTVDFVLHRRPAWCSWFASGMVLMLRSLDVPAHIVSGWRSMEYNPISGIWVVKEKEAHDWVEVLDLRRGVWVRFDPTPPNQIEALTHPKSSWGNLHLLWDSVMLWLQASRQALHGLNLKQALIWLQTGAVGLLRSPWFYGVLIVLGGLNQWLKQRRSKGLPIQATELLDYAPLRPDLAQNLALFQPWCQRRGLNPLAFPLEQVWTEEAVSQLSETERADLRGCLTLLNQQRFAPPDETRDAGIRAYLQNLLAQDRDSETKLSKN